VIIIPIDTKVEKSPVEATGAICPACGVPAVNIARGIYVSTLQCVACGWHMPVNRWNALSKAERKALKKQGNKKHKVSITKGLKKKLGVSR